MKSEHKIEFAKTFEPIKQSRWFYLFSIVALIIWILFLPETKVVIWVSIFFIGIPILFQVILHINYYLHDKNVTLEIDYGNRLFTYSKSTEKIIIPFEKVKRIVRYQGSKYPRPFDYYTIPSNFYHYNVVETTDNKRVKFTDFVKGEIGIYDIEKKTVIIPFLNLIT